MFKSVKICLFLLLSAISPVFSQQIVNKYAAVSYYVACLNAFLVDSTNDFHVGDTVLVIQMKDAVISQSNDSSYGEITNYRAAGNYGYNVVSHVGQDSMYFKYAFNSDFHLLTDTFFFGLVQVVKVPYYQNYDLNQPHTCMPWNGKKGGVFAINVANTLTLNSTIDVSGAGFKGGQVSLKSQSGCNRVDYFYDGAQNMGALKGEGIAVLTDDYVYGRGEVANGGGGGNDNKAGGGGGANAGAGGLGGNQFNVSGCSSSVIPVIGGIGGRSLSYSTGENKIFMGGGGGAGHGNELGEKPGGDGGGIVIINAGQIISNTGSHVDANGEDAPECSGPSVGCQNDGTGGGGAGGAVFLNSNSYSGGLVINAHGGRGANAWVSSGHTEVGPGGGGGGGAVIFKQNTSPTGTFNVSGGTNGVLPQFGNTSWGALAGQTGQILSFNNVVFPSNVFNNQGYFLDFDFEKIGCNEYRLINLTTKTQLPSDSTLYYEWHLPPPMPPQLQSFGNSSISQTFEIPSGDYTISLFGNSFTSDYSCTHVLTKTVHVGNFANAGEAPKACLGMPFELHGSGGVKYHWSGEGVNYPDSADVTVRLFNPGIYPYILTVTDSLGCLDNDTVDANVLASELMYVTSENSQITCEDKPTQLFATGADSFIWSPGIYCNDSTIASPLVVIPQTTTFTVTGYHNEGCVSVDTITISRYKGNLQSFIPNAFSPNGDGLNDEFTPIMLCGFNLTQLSIYNRFGQRIFSTNRPGKGWDGTFNNKPSDSGTYFYYITGKKDDGSEGSIKGEISLIR